MENKSVYIFFFVALLFDAGLIYGSYRFGRYTMKQDMTPAITENIEGAYYEGRKDGIAEGKKEGYKAAFSAFLQEEDERGR